MTRRKPGNEQAKTIPAQPQRRRSFQISFNPPQPHSEKPARSRSFGSLAGRSGDTRRFTNWIFLLTGRRIHSAKFYDFTIGDASLACKFARPKCALYGAA